MGSPAPLGTARSSTSCITSLVGGLLGKLGLAEASIGSFGGLLGKLGLAEASVVRSCFSISGITEGPIEGNEQATFVRGMSPERHPPP